MEQKTFLLLGGYGNTGRLLSHALLQETGVHLVIAGRSQEKANRAAAELNALCGDRRAVGLAVDAADPASLRAALPGVDLVLAASSTARYAGQVAAAALEAGCDYLDIQYSTRKFQALKSLAPQVEAAGRCFITDGGFHPGLPAALARYAGGCFDTLEQANVGSVIKIDWAALDLPDETLIELLEEITDYQPLRFTGGRWEQMSMWGMQSPLKMDFGREFGVQACVPMFLEELRNLPALYPSLRETGFFVGSFNPIVDWLVLPVAWAGLRLWPQRALKPAGRFMKWGLETFTKPPYGTLLKLEARGRQDGVPKNLDVTLYHPDGYQLTAIPVVACLLQYLDGSIRRPGLWTQGELVEPARLLKDIQRMGVQVEILG